MKKIFSYVLPVVKGLVFCAMAIQIVMGALYIGSNFMTVPVFDESQQYLEMARTLVIDEYAGILYPLLIRLCQLPSVVPYQILLYGLQLFMGLFSVYHFVYTWTDRPGVALTCSLWINTIPFVAQAHVTVLPHSLVFSLLVIMLLEILKDTRHREPLALADLTVVLCSYTFLVQLGREYFFAGTLLVLWSVVVQLYARKRQMMMFWVTALICVGVVLSNSAIYGATQKEGAYGRMQRSVEGTFFLRTGMSIMEDRFMVYMPDDITECFDGAELKEFAKYPYKLQKEFGPTLEDRYGPKTANELYWKLGLIGLGNATKDTLKGIGEDTLSYGFPAGMYFTWRSGDLKGITSWNYQQFIEKVPRLSVNYIKLSQFFWLIGFVGATAAGIILAVRKGRYYVRIWLPVVVYVIIYGLYFALQGTNVYDYKLALLPLALSYAWIGCIFFHPKWFLAAGEDDQEREELYG